MVWAPLLRGDFDDDAVGRRMGRNGEVLHGLLHALLKEVLRRGGLQRVSAVPLGDVDQLKSRGRTQCAMQPQRPETWLSAQEFGAFPPFLDERVDVVGANLENVDERDHSSSSPSRGQGPISL